MARHSISKLNGLSCGAFVAITGPVFENSPWIAEASWPKRPFADLAALHRAMCETVGASPEERKLALIRAHPDLVGRAALAGTLTPQSTAEQAAAGLNTLTVDEIAIFRSSNEAYRKKFGFPFVICARANKKKAILEGFRQRLDHSREEEIATALEEIYKIAYFRLQDIVSG